MLDKPVPDFEIAASDGTTFQLSQHKGKPLVLYFYPRDNTPGCTTEAMEFRDLHDQFAKAQCAIFGISRDSLKAHDGFKCKLELPFELLSDPDEIACKLFGVIKMKKMYGREVRGIERSTFLIDKSGVLRKEWRGVKVAAHAQEVLNAVKSLT
jgi:thioredoxin-dependent peroxiredoxin